MITNFYNSKYIFSLLVYTVLTRNLNSLAVSYAHKNGRSIHSATITKQGCSSLKRMSMLTYKADKCEFIRLHPSWVTGFSDAESCFNIAVFKSSSNKTGWGVKPTFRIDLHKKDAGLLKMIKTYFESVSANGDTFNKTSGSIGMLTLNRLLGCNIGNLSVPGSAEKASYVVSSLEELKFIIAHFDDYPLLTEKRESYRIWREIVLMIERKEHLTIEGLKKIVKLKATLNWGLSEALITAFQINTLEDKVTSKEAVVKEDLKEAVSLGHIVASSHTEKVSFHPQWLGGFVSGDGSFMIQIEKKDGKYFPRLIFQLTQHSCDTELMVNLTSYLGCGGVSKNSESTSAVKLRVTKFSDICTKIIPLFQGNLILGVKSKDFADWCIAADIIKNKGHLTQAGLDKIQELKANMNKERDY